MTNKFPIFSIHEPQHFSDYGFHPQFDYFQVLEQARNLQKRESSNSFRSAIDNLQFNLQKPISKDDTSKKIKKTRSKRWWNNAIHFFKRKRTSDNNLHHVYGIAGARAISGPVYLLESRSVSASTTPYHRKSTSQPSSRPLAGTITPTRNGDLDIPYVSLNELNMDQTHKTTFIASPVPIYLVT